VNEVVVTAPARLHFGMLDPAGIGSRRFGGCGVAVESPRVVVRVRRVGSESSEDVTANGPQADRAAAFARRARDGFGLRGGIEVDVREAIPPHVGLGSGTKLGLAIARGVAELAGVSAGPEELADASGRGARSSVGAWTFEAPGLVVEAGVRDEGSISPLVARHPMPERWRCVLALPVGVEGLSGNAEERFFGLLHQERAAIEPRVSRLVLTALLPGLVTHDIDEFGAALGEIQREIGSMFAARQGGVFHPRAAPVVEALLELGVGAVGQSSWGPSVYGIVDGPERAAEVADRLRAAMHADTDVRVVDFDRRGAWVARDGAGQAAA
jgi:beta-ribofuranosylaminobenzene 5'-phosphate synthase